MIDGYYIILYHFYHIKKKIKGSVTENRAFFVEYTK